MAGAGARSLFLLKVHRAISARLSLSLSRFPKDVQCWHCIFGQSVCRLWVHLWVRRWICRWICLCHWVCRVCKHTCIYTCMCICGLCLRIGQRILGQTPGRKILGQNSRRKILGQTQQSHRQRSLDRRLCRPCRSRPLTNIQYTLYNLYKIYTQ